MAIYDFGGTALNQLKKLYDFDGTALNQLKKLYDFDGAALHQIYSAASDEYLFDGNGEIAEHPITYFGSATKYPRSDSLYAGGWSGWYADTADVAVQFVIEKTGQYKNLNFSIYDASSSSGWYTRIGVNASKASGNHWYHCGATATEIANVQVTKGNSVSNTVRSVDISNLAPGTYYAWIRIERQGNDNYAYLRANQIWLSVE